MGGPKIFVLQIKDVIRTAVFAGLGLILIILLVILFIPKGRSAQPPEPSSLYIPGTYSSSIILNDRPLDVRVTVSENEITAVDMTEMAEIQQVFYPLFTTAMNDLAMEVLTYQSADIVPNTDYPVTSEILRMAVATALDRAFAGE
jgi:uncharacterized protein with FMN-binding domain